MGEAKRRQQSTKFVAIADVVKTQLYPNFSLTGVVDKEMHGLIGRQIQTPEGFQKYETKITGVAVWLTSESDEPDYKANTGYGISYFAQKQVCSEKVEERQIALVLPNGGEINFFYTKKEPISKRELGSQLESVIQSLPGIYKVLVDHTIAKAKGQIQMIDKPALYPLALM